MKMLICIVASLKYASSITSLTTTTVPSAGEMTNSLPAGVWRSGSRKKLRVKRKIAKATATTTYLARGFGMRMKEPAIRTQQTTTTVKNTSCPYSVINRCAPGRAIKKCAISVLSAKIPQNVTKKKGQSQGSGDSDETIYFRRLDPILKFLSGIRLAFLE